MALTLQDMAQGSKDKVIAGVLMQLARQSKVMRMIPFDMMDSFWEKMWQLESVSDLGFRDIGDTYNDVKDTFSEVFEGIHFMGGKVDTDTALLRAKNKELDVHTQNTVDLMPLRWRYTFLEKFINGDRTSDPKEFNGLKKRVEDVGGDQVIAAGGLDLSASNANRQQFLDHLDQAIFEIEDGAPDAILTSKKGHFSLTRVARREGLLDITKDSFDREVQMYRGFPIIYMGTKGDQSSEIITDTETAAGARTGGTNTSYYFVKFGGPTNVVGLQMNQPERIFDDVIDDGVTRRTVFEWAVGLAVLQQKSVVRLRGVKPI